MKQKQVLIVEDDTELAHCLKILFKGLTGTEPIVAYQMAAATTAMQGNKIDLVILDIMLPQDEAAFNLICGHNKTIAELRKTIDSLDSDGSAWTAERAETLEDARQKRRSVLASIQKLIKVDGGIQLLNVWQQNATKSTSAKVVFLTAVGDTRVGGYSNLIHKFETAWLVKPVSNSIILASAARLLACVQETSTQ
jgi:response regulator of citrate/malate metabolism